MGQDRPTGFFLAEETILWINDVANGETPESSQSRPGNTWPNQVGPECTPCHQPRRAEKPAKPNTLMGQSELARCSAPRADDFD